MKNRDRGERKRFEYKQRDASTIKTQANQKGGTRDGFIKAQFPTFSPQAGEKYRIRIMPPTWDGAEHYAYPVEVHYGVGADNNQYACLAKMKNEECPVCEERNELIKHRNNKAADDAKAKTRKVMWIIDRDREEDGPMLWTPSWIVDRDIAAEAEDEETNETVFYDDPYKGRDVLFKCVKKGDFTEIKGIKPASRETPLHRNDDRMQKWLRFITKHPIPDCIEFFDAEHITKALVGGIGNKKRKDDDDEDDDRPRTRRDRERRRHDEDDDDEDDDRKSRRRSFRDDDEADDDDEDLDDDSDVDDEDEDGDDGRRSRGKKRRAASKRDDDDDEEGDDDGEELQGGDEEETRDSRRHKRRKRLAHKPSSRREKESLDDEDDDLD